MHKKIRAYRNYFKVQAVKQIVDNNGNISAAAKPLGRTLSSYSKLIVTYPIRSYFNLNIPCINWFMAF